MEECTTEFVDEKVECKLVEQEGSKEIIVTFRGLQPDVEAVVDDVVKNGLDLPSYPPLYVSNKTIFSFRL